jgi:ribonuclease G
MSDSILINITAQECRVALLEAGTLAEVYVERRQSANLAGNVYKGRVVRVLPGMRSAFVDIGLDKAAFLYVADIRADIVEEYATLFEDESLRGLDFSRERSSRHALHIEELLREGQEIVVQVSKNPLGSKGARVTSYITLPGRYLVLMPNLEHVGVSRRISHEAERQRLRQVVEALRPQGFGLIVRTASEGAGQEELRRDLEFLLSLWQSIQDKAQRTRAPSLLYSDLDPVLRAIRDLMSPSVQHLVLDSQEHYLSAKEFAEQFFPELAPKIELYEAPEPIFEHYGIEGELARALERKVWLKSGGYIVIDQTEAMTVIDVNTGRYVGKEDLEDTILRTNLEAAREIACQVRLRNLGGIIIIDFIDMERAENRAKVLQALQEALKKDRARSSIFHTTELGLVQMTRKRVRESLLRTLSEPCPYCEGRGYVKSAATLCYEILRKSRKMISSGARKLLILAHPAVAEFLLEEERQALEALEAQWGVKITITEEPHMHQNHYEITAL